MCPSNPELKLAALNISIRDSWSEEELVRFLAERKAEDPLPQDVLVGLDFSLVDPRIFTGENPAYAQRYKSHCAFCSAVLSSIRNSWCLAVNTNAMM